MRDLLKLPKHLRTLRNNSSLTLTSDRQARFLTQLSNPNPEGTTEILSGIAQF